MAAGVTEPANCASAVVRALWNAVVNRPSSTPEAMTARLENVVRSCSRARDCDDASCHAPTPSATPVNSSTSRAMRVPRRRILAAAGEG